MDELRFALADVVEVFDAQVGSFVRAASGMGDVELLGPSACRGWGRLDLVVHVRSGLDEMAATAGVPSGMAPTHDAASYWRSYMTESDDPVASTMWLRRTASAYARPSLAVSHLSDAAARAQAVARHMPDRPLLFQGKTMSAGDFLATWIVELAVHELDLGVDGTPPGCVIARRTLEALAGKPLPADWDDSEAVLAALGRIPWPDGAPSAGFPVNL